MELHTQTGHKSGDYYYIYWCEFMLFSQGAAILLGYGGVQWTGV